METIGIQQVATGLVLAALLGGLIGLERELHSQPAGLRTHMVVSIGSALIMMLSVDIAFRRQPPGDPGRIAAQVVSGMGFLGAGAILRFGASVRGLTTAACLWCSAAIGLACGARYYAEATLATALVLLSIFVFDWVERTYIRGTAYRTFVILARDESGLIGRAESALARFGVTIKDVGVQKEVADNSVRLTVRGAAPEGMDVAALVQAISSLPGVQRIQVE